MTTKLANEIRKFLLEQESIAWSIDRKDNIYDDDTVEGEAFRLLQQVVENHEEEADPIDEAQSYWLNS